MDLQTQLTEIERGLWTNDAALYEASLTEDAVLVFAETGVITRQLAVDAIRVENAQGRRWAEVRFDDVRCLPLTDTAALLTYRAAARWEHQIPTIQVLASSVYVAREGTWKLAFHQQSQLKNA